MGVEPFHVLASQVLEPDCADVRHEVVSHHHVPANHGGISDLTRRLQILDPVLEVPADSPFRSLDVAAFSFLLLQLVHRRRRQLFAAESALHYLVAPGGARRLQINDIRP